MITKPIKYKVTFTTKTDDKNIIVDTHKVKAFTAKEAVGIAATKSNLFAKKLPEIKVYEVPLTDTVHKINTTVEHRKWFRKQLNYFYTT